MVASCHREDINTEEDCDTIRSSVAKSTETVLRNVGNRMQLSVKLSSEIIKITIVLCIDLLLI